MLGNNATSRISAQCKCKGIIFDLDDTLVPTSSIDKHAVASAARLAANLVPNITATLNGGDALADRFRSLLKAEPFPPTASGGIEITVACWRSMLWARAIWPPESALGSAEISHVLDCIQHSAENSGECCSISASEVAFQPTHVKNAETAKLVHDRWCERRLQSFRFPESIANLILELRLQDGYELAIVTNGHSDVQRPKLERCGAADLFASSDRLIIAGDFPAMKPDKAVFLAAAAAMGIDIGEAIMVGDSLRCDIGGGNAAGCLATVHVKRCPMPEDTPQVGVSRRQEALALSKPLASSFWDRPASESEAKKPANIETPTASINSVLNLRPILAMLNGSST